MDIVHEQGRVFGVANVIDVLIVLLVVALAVGGLLALAGPDPEPEPETRYGTFAYEAQLGSAAANVSESTTLSARNGPKGTPSSTSTAVSPRTPRATSWCASATPGGRRPATVTSTAAIRSG